MSKSKFEQLCDDIVSRPGAAERIQADVDRMNRVLELEKLRRGAKLTQSQLARRMGLSQRRVSAIEHSSDTELKLDTLRRYVESLGGELEITAVIDGDRIPLPIR